MSSTASGVTLENLRARRDEILRIAAARGAHNIRVFGSVAPHALGTRSRDKPFRYAETPAFRRNRYQVINA